MHISLITIVVDDYDDFDTVFDRMNGAGVEFSAQPRNESYGGVTVFSDHVGNRWDMLGLA